MKRNHTARPSRRLPPRSRALRDRRFFRPLMEQLEKRRVLAVDFDQVATEVDSGISGITAALKGIDSVTRLPLINAPIDEIKDLTDSLTNFQTDLRDALNELPNDSDAGAIKEAIFDVLSPLEVLANRNGSGCTTDRSCITADDIDVALTATSVDVKLNLAYTAARFDAAVGLGIPSVPLKPAPGSPDGSFSVEVGYSDFNFGYNGEAYFQNTPGQLKLTLKGSLPSDPLTVGLGFINFQAEDKNPGPDVTLTLTSDVTSTGISPPTIGGLLDLRLGLNVAVKSEGMPQLSTTFVLHWPINTVSPKDALSPAWGSPTLRFEDVKLGLGSVLGNIAQPIAQHVKEIMDPLKPVFDLLERRIPGLDDISQQVGGPPVTLLSTVSTLPDALPPELVNMVRAVDTLRGYYQKVSSLAGHGGWLDLGTFNISGNSGNLLSEAASQIGTVALDGLGRLLPIQPDWSNLISPNGTPNTVAIKDQIRALLGNTVGNEVVGIFEQLTKSEQKDGLKFAFPIIDSTSDVVLGMLLGKDKDLVTVEGKLTFDFSKEIRFRPIPLVFIVLDGQANFLAEAKIGYDTLGLREAMKPLYDGEGFRPERLLNGLWIGKDTHIDASGQMRLRGEFGVPNVLIGGVGGGFDIDFDVDISNPRNLDKIRPTRGDLQDRLFSVSGQMTAFADVDIKIGFQAPPPVGFLGFHKTWRFAEAPLFEFKSDSIAVPGDLVPPPEAQEGPGLFTYFPEQRQLQLNVGDTAAFRGLSPGAREENFTVKHVGRYTVPVISTGLNRTYDVFDITFLGTTERFEEGVVDRFVADMGSDNDTLTVIDTFSPILYRLTGGGGDDVIDVDGNVDAQLFGDYRDLPVQGDEGNDTLDAGNGNNDPTSRRPTTIRSGPGFDQITFG
jgi:hypothetical protein